jgi:transposase-like protein
MRTAEEMEFRCIANPECCPFCDSANIDADTKMEFDGGQAWRGITCNNCNKKWVEIFNLVGVTFNIDDLDPRQL